MWVWVGVGVWVGVRMGVRVAECGGGAVGYVGRDRVCDVDMHEIDRIANCQ